MAIDERSADTLPLPPLRVFTVYWRALESTHLYIGKQGTTYLFTAETKELGKQARAYIAYLFGIEQSEILIDKITEG